MTEQQQPAIPPEDRVLNWIPRFDTRSLRFTVAKRGIVPKTPRNRHWTRNAWLDQGREGACTGFGLAHVVSSTPRAQAMTDEMAQQFYYEARRNDEWPGENYEGSSVLGAMQAGRKMGFLTAYWWATTLEEIVAGVSQYGPMEWGTDWFDGMWEPDKDGFLHVAGTVVGGHAFQVGAVDVDRKAFRIDNSWGPGWGVNGSAWLSFADAEKLRQRRGEFALPRKIKPRH